MRSMFLRWRDFTLGRRLIREQELALQEELVQEEEEKTDTEEESEYEFDEEEESRRGSIVEGFSIEDS